MINKLSPIFAALLLIFIWVSFLDFTRPILIESNLFGTYYTKIGLFIFGCVISPLWEELIYRHVPFQITKKINTFTKQDFTWITLVLTSFWFGSAHDNGIYNILLQGVAGMIIGIVYLLNKHSYWSAVAVHAGWNFLYNFVFN